jgi:hypothetical protein
MADHSHLWRRLRSDTHHRDLSRSRFALVVAVLLVVAFGVAIAWAALASSHPSPAAVSTPTATAAVAGECHSVNGLPDPVCTPGVADPRVTQDNILTTICVSGYTTRVRPSSGYTDALKQQQIKAYGYADTNLTDYEEDHLIPLELGGHPTDPKNLWPEPLAGPYPATKKDGVENSLHTKVCAGLTTLNAAQAAIAKNWESTST